MRIELPKLLAWLDHTEAKHADLLSKQVVVLYDHKNYEHRAERLLRLTYDDRSLFTDTEYTLLCGVVHGGVEVYTVQPPTKAEVLELLTHLEQQALLTPPFQLWENLPRRAMRLLHARTPPKGKLYEACKQIAEGRLNYI